MKSIAFAVMMLLVGVNVEANEYYDYNNGTFVEITEGEIEEGSEIEYFDHQVGAYRYGEITGIDSAGDVEVVEYDSGRIRYWEEQ
ncbi:MAG: hypothetical protein ACRC6V_05720 [Bacteroidales bacterium]